MSRGHTVELTRRNPHPPLSLTKGGDPGGSRQAMPFHVLTRGNERAQDRRLNDRVL